MIVKFKYDDGNKRHYILHFISLQFNVYDFDLIPTSS